MSDINMVILTGNLVDDPDLRFTQSGAAVCSFRIAHTERVFNRETNEWSDGKSVFINVIAWRQFAENVVGSLGKGTPVIVTGKLSQRSYDHKDGHKVTVVEIEATEVAPQISRGEAKFTRARAAAAAAAAPSAPAAAPVAAPVAAPAAPAPAAPVPAAPVPAAPVPAGAGMPAGMEQPPF